MKLNLGSGYKRYPGYLNVDSSPHCAPDYVVNMGKEPLPFPDSSVEEIVLEHVLEHIGEEFFTLMKDIYRVCKPSAIVKITVPFPRHDTFLIDPTHVRPILPATLAMLGKQHNLNDIERGGRETPLGIIHDVDFELLDYRYHLEPKYQELFKTLSEEECVKIVDSSWNVIIETDIILMVKK